LVKGLENTQWYIMTLKRKKPALLNKHWLQDKTAPRSGASFNIFLQPIVGLLRDLRLSRTSEVYSK